MNHSKLESRLRRATLTTPGIALAEVKSRATRRHASPGLRRLAVAAVGVWAVACLAQLMVDRQVTGVSGSPPAPLSAHVDDARVPHGLRWTVVWQPGALDELLGDTNVSGPKPVGRPADGADQHRQSSTHQRWIGRLTHV